MRQTYQRTLIANFVRFLNTGKDLFSPGVLRNRDGQPILKLDSPATVEDTRREGQRLFRSLAEPNGHSVVGTELVASGGVLVTPFWAEEKEVLALLAPSVHSPLQLARALALLAMTTPTRQGDALSNRVAVCQQCGALFLLPTRKRSRFCSKGCRWKMDAQKKKNLLDSGSNMGY